MQVVIAVAVSEMTKEAKNLIEETTRQFDKEGITFRKVNTAIPAAAAALRDKDVQMVIFSTPRMFEVARYLDIQLKNNNRTCQIIVFNDPDSAVNMFWPDELSTADILSMLVLDT